MDTPTESPVEANHAFTTQLADARALADRSQHKAALKQLERVRQAALAAEDVPLLEQVLDLARLIRERTHGKRQYEAGRLAYETRESIRSVSHKQALAEGREWIDPLPGPRPPADPRALSSDSKTAWRAEWPWAPWALTVWLLAITATGAALGASESGYEISVSTWAAEAALVGLGFGLGLGLFLPRPLWRHARGDRWLVPIAVGSALYALAYVISVAVGYPGDDDSTSGLGVVFFLTTTICLGPMIIAAALGTLGRVTIAMGGRRVLRR
jgi:hypothetical protein